MNLREMYKKVTGLERGEHKFFLIFLIGGGVGHLTGNIIPRFINYFSYLFSFFARGIRTSALENMARLSILSTSYLLACAITLDRVDL